MTPPGVGGEIVRVTGSGDRSGNRLVEADAMPGLSAHGTTLVGNVRRAFEEEHGVPARVCHGMKVASDDAAVAPGRGAMPDGPGSLGQTGANEQVR